MSAPPVGLVAWKGTHARNFTGSWHWELLEYPYSLFCDAILPARGIIDRREDATGISETDICKKCTAGMDKAAALRLKLERTDG